MSNPLVTIAVTAFNAEDTIERALSSALAQDWRPLEVLVVDDASSDSTVDRIRVVASRNPSVRLICHTHNLGVARARNTLLEEASGEFVVFFDDDDVSLPNRVAAQVGRIRSYEQKFEPEGPVVCHTSRLQVMPDGSMRTEPTMGMNEGSRAPFGIAVANRILTGRPLKDSYGALATCSQAARRLAYIQIGGFDGDFRRSEDTELAIRFALSGAHFVGISEPLVHQAMTLAKEKTLSIECKSMLRVLEKHRDLFQNYREYSFARQWLKLKYKWIGGRRFEFGLALAALAITSPWKTTKRLVYALPMSGSRAGQAKLYHRVEATGDIT